MKRSDSPPGSGVPARRDVDRRVGRRLRPRACAACDARARRGRPRCRSARRSRARTRGTAPRTSHDVQIFFASRVEPPFSGKNASGSVCAHSESVCQASGLSSLDVRLPDPRNAQPDRIDEPVVGNAGTIFGFRHIRLPPSCTDHPERRVMSNYTGVIRRSQVADRKPSTASRLHGATRRRVRDVIFARVRVTLRAIGRRSGAARAPPTRSRPSRRACAASASRGRARRARRTATIRAGSPGRRGRDLGRERRCR